MTAIGGHVARSRKPGVLGVHSIGEFVLRVPDLKPAEAFYGAFGLDVREEGDGLALRTPGGGTGGGGTGGDGHRWGRVVEGPRKAMGHVTFHCFEEDLPRFRGHLEEQRVPLTDAPPGFDSNGLWFRDMDGMPVQITVGPKTSPDEKTAPEFAPTPPGLRNAPYRSTSDRRAPRRLSHILRFTADVPAATAFYSRVLGLRLSDRTGDVIAFLHGVHGSDHHLMAFAKSPGPGLHHLSWDVPSIEAIGLGAMAMADKGFSKGWGFGRHVLGSNYFHYVRDPWGSYSEFSCDIDHVPASMDWEGMDHRPEDGFYLWGPEPPPDFVVNHEAETA